MFGAPLLPRTLEAALRDLGAAKPAVRAASARDLAKHGHVEGAREPVIRGLQRALRDEAAEVRAVAATALADLGGAEALAELLVAVEDDDMLVRQMAITALGEIGDPRATERLRRALRDDRAEVRFQAVMAFPRVCASRDDAHEALLAATRDEDPLVCHIALRMAEELGEAGGVDGRMCERARALLGHASAEVRVASAVLLGRAGDGADGVAAILQQVALGEIRTRDREDVAAAIELAGELDLKGARPGLERRAFGGLLGLRRDPFAWNARVALARMGHERACREILGELGAGDRDIRTLAVAAAGRAQLVAARERIAAMRGREALADPHAVDEALAALTAVTAVAADHEVQA
jgi:HEAT repeats